jgi:hypothetical protein
MERLRLARALACAASLVSLPACGELTRQITGGGASVLVDDAQGIQIGNQVRVHGVQVGRVTAVTLEPEGARLAIELEGAELRSDACAGVRAQGLVGEVYVHVEPGGAESPWEGGELAACQRPTIEDATTESLAELAGLVTDLRTYVSQLQSGERALCTVSAAAPTLGSGSGPAAASASGAGTGTDTGSGADTGTDTGAGAASDAAPGSAP